MGIHGVAEAVPVACFVHAFLQCQPLVQQHFAALLAEGSFEVGGRALRTVFFPVNRQLIACGKLDRFVQFD